LFLHLDYPDVERERQIVLAKVPGIEASLADQVVRTVKLVREMELKKAPSVSETIDWARTLLLLGVAHLDVATARSTLNVLLKHTSDIERASKDLAPAPA
jgi:MoxR-like ATPase